MAVMTRSALYHRIDSLRRRYGVRGVFDPYAYLAQRDIPLTTHRFANPDLHGILVRAGHQVGIVLDTRLTPAQQRFTLAHEIVHLELHHGEPGIAAFITDGGEYQADEGAAELLMPYRDFIPRAAALHRKLMQDPTAAISRLAAHYRLDRETVRRRLRALDRELALYRSGVPVTELVPLSQRAKQRMGEAEPRFLRRLQPVRMTGIDILGESEDL